MADDDNAEFFKALAKPGGAYDPLGGHSDDSEWALIRKVMKAAGCFPHHEKHVLDRFRSDCPAQRWPNLSWLRGVIDLPVVFGRRQVPFQSEALIDIAKRFTKTPCYQAWLEVAQDADQDGTEDRAVVVAFRWPQWGDMVIHDLENDPPVEGTFLVHYHSGTRFVIEPAAGFLARLRLPAADQWLI